MMPFFNNTHRMKTYSKCREKNNLCAITAFDKLLHDHQSSHVFSTQNESLCSPAANDDEDDAESDICQRTNGEKRTRSQEEELFSIASREDQSSKCKRRRNITSQGKRMRIGDDQVKERVSLRKKQPSQNMKTTYLPSTSSPDIEEMSIAAYNSKVIGKHHELHTATDNDHEGSEKQIPIERSRSGITFLHKQSFDQRSSLQGIRSNRHMHTICTTQSPEIQPLTIQQVNLDAKTTVVDQNKNHSLKSITRHKDKADDSYHNSYSSPDFEKSKTLISVSMDMSKATDDMPQDTATIHEHLNNDLEISISNRDSNDCNIMMSPKENQLKAKTFVHKLSKLFAGKKCLFNDGLPCVAQPTTTSDSSVISRGSHMREEAPSHRHESTSELLLQFQHSYSVTFSHNSNTESSPSVHLLQSFPHSDVHRDSSHTLPLDAYSHSKFVAHQCSALAEHNYFRCLEHDEKRNNDHNYSLLSLVVGKFTSSDDAPNELSDKVCQNSCDSVTAATQPLSTPHPPPHPRLRRSNTDMSYTGTEFSSKETTFNDNSDVDECCAVLLLSPLQESPSQKVSTRGRLIKEIGSHRNEKSCMNTQVVHPSRSKSLKDKIMLNEGLQQKKKTMNEIHVSNSVTSQDYQNKSGEKLGENNLVNCLDSSNIALTPDRNDPLECQPTVLKDFVEETLIDSQSNQLHLRSEKFGSSFQMQNSDNCRETLETFPDLNNSDDVNIGNSQHTDYLHRQCTTTENCTNPGRSPTTTTTSSSSVNNSHEHKTCRRPAVCVDFKEHLIQDRHLQIEIHQSRLDSRRRSNIRSDRRTTRQGSKRTKTNDRHLRHGVHSTDHATKRIRRCVKTHDNETLQTSNNSFEVDDNDVLESGLSAAAAAADGLPKARCDSNHLLIEHHTEQKPEKKTSIISEHTLQNSVRRLLKSPLKTSSNAKAVYNPRQWIHPAKDEESMDCAKGQMAKAASAVEEYEFSTCEQSSAVLSRVSSWPKRLQGSDVVKVRVSRDEKKLFTVVHNVREAHECQEYGEKQEFQDDVEYMLDGLHHSQPLATRCLSTLSLASKCLLPAFRMHIRAHGILTKILDALQDAPDFVSLSLCLSAFFFTMSRDRVAIELDEFSVRLILRLIDANSTPHSDNVSEQVSAADDELERIRIKVFDICNATIHSTKTPLDVKLKLSDITTGYLGLELLLSLTSKQTANWLKETLRSNGGLKHIVNALCHCTDEITSFSCSDEAFSRYLPLYIQSEKCLKVLDNVTYMCRENQSFILEYRSSVLIEALNSLLDVCTRDLASEECDASCQSCSAEKVNKDCSRFLLSTSLLTLLRLLLNITHDSERGCFVIGQQKSLLLRLLSTVLSTSAIVCAVHQFDLSILGLSLLMNLVENCEENRKRFIQLKTHVPNNSDSEEEETSALHSLGFLFSQSFNAAQMIEEAHDAKIDAAEKQQKKLTAKSSLALGSAETDDSGQWVESESGLQWVAKDEEEQEELLPEAFKASHNRTDSEETPSSSQDDTDNYTRDLHTAGKHMEDSIVAAYAAVLIGCVIQQDVHLADTVRKTLPEFSFTPLVRMIRKFLGFMNFTNLTSASGSKTFHDVLKVLESLSAEQRSLD